MKFFDEDDEQGLPDIDEGFFVLMESSLDDVLMEGGSDKIILEGAP